MFRYTTCSFFSCFWRRLSLLCCASDGWDERLWFRSCVTVILSPINGEKEGVWFFVAVLGVRESELHSSRASMCDVSIVKRTNIRSQIKLHFLQVHNKTTQNVRLTQNKIRTCQFMIRFVWRSNIWIVTTFSFKRTEIEGAMSHKRWKDKRMQVQNNTYCNGHPQMFFDQKLKESLKR